MRRTVLTLLLCLFVCSAPPARAAEFIRGNANGDAVVDLSDPIFILIYLFGRGEASCLDALDANDDGALGIVDALRVLSALYADTWPLPAPAVECGPDPTVDELDCLEASLSCPALLEVAIESGTRVAASGDRLAYDLFCPVSRRYAPPPYPAVVLTHGFARSKDQHRNNASYLAERGMIVLTPNLSSLLGGAADQIRNIENTADHVNWLISRSLSPGDPIEGLLDPEKIGLAGHSAGGAVTLEAALALQSTDTLPAAVCLLDAVPWERTLDTAPGLVALPFCSVRSEPSSCNANGSIRPLLESLSFPVEDVTIVGGTHCDPENPTDFFCTLLCGGSSDVRRGYFQRLMYLFFQDAFGMASIEATPQTYAEYLGKLEAQGDARRSGRR